MSFVQLLQRFFRVQKVDTMYYNVIHYIVSTFVELLQVRCGISSLKGQGHFHFAKGTSIGKSESQWGTFERGTKAKTRGNGGHGLCDLCITPGLVLATIIRLLSKTVPSVSFSFSSSLRANNNIYIFY